MDGIRNVKQLSSFCIVAMLAYFCLAVYIQSNGSRNPEVALPGYKIKIACDNTTLDKWACKYGINYSNTNKNGEFEKAGESKGATADEFSDPKTLLALMRSDYAPSKLVRLVEIMKNRRGLPNYFMEKMTTGQRKNYSDSNVVFMHHHKAGGSTTKAILESIHRNLSIPSVLISILNSKKQFATYKAKGTSERTIFNGGCTFGICDVLHGRPCSYMTVNRDTYDRVISSYFYCLKNHGDTLCGPVNVKNMSIVHWAIHQGSHFFRQLLFYGDTCRKGPNSTRYVRDYMERTRDTIPYNTIIPERSTCWLRQKAFLQETLTKDYRRAILNYCLDNLHKWFAVIGLLEEFDISLQLFEATFGLPFKKFFTGKKNVGIIRSTINKKKDRELRAQLQRNPEVKEALHEDLMIYEATKKIMKFQKEAFLELENETHGQDR